MSTVRDPMTGRLITVATGAAADPWFKPGVEYGKWLRAHNLDEGAHERLNAGARAFRMAREAELDARLAAKLGAK